MGVDLVFLGCIGVAAVYIDAKTASRMQTLRLHRLDDELVGHLLRRHDNTELATQADSSHPSQQEGIIAIPAALRQALNGGDGITPPQVRDELEAPGPEPSALAGGADGCSGWSGMHWAAGAGWHADELVHLRNSSPAHGTMRVVMRKDLLLCLHDLWNDVRQRVVRQLAGDDKATHAGHGRYDLSTFLSGGSVEQRSFLLCVLQSLFGVECGGSGAEPG